MSEQQEEIIARIKKNLDEGVKQVTAIVNNTARAQASLEAIELLKSTYVPQFGKIRQQSVAALYHDEGQSLRHISEMLNINVSRAQQLASGITPYTRKQWKKSVTDL